MYRNCDSDARWWWLMEVVAVVVQSDYDGSAHPVVVLERGGAILVIQVHDSGGDKCMAIMVVVVHMMWYR